MSAVGWEAIKTFYVETFGLSGELVELLSDSDILRMCVSGASNESISNLLDIDEVAVCSIITQVLQFKGWEEDLPLNPYKVFSHLRDNHKKLFSHFKNEIGDSCSGDAIADMYRSCKIYETISLKLDKEWI